MNFTFVLALMFPRAFWQYDDNGASTPGGAAGTIPGISGNVDVDYFMNGGVYPNIDALCF